MLVPHYQRRRYAIFPSRVENSRRSTNDHAANGQGDLSGLVDHGALQSDLNRSARRTGKETTSLVNCTGNFVAQFLNSLYPGISPVLSVPFLATNTRLFAFSLSVLSCCVFSCFLSALSFDSTMYRPRALLKEIATPRSPAIQALPARTSDHHLLAEEQALGADFLIDLFHSCHVPVCWACVPEVEAFLFF